MENAVKHGFTGAKLEIRINVEESKDEILIKVRDNGAGMSKVQLFRLYENKTEKNPSLEGNGIALKNIRSRMQLYYSRNIKIKSEKGWGTEITLPIPLHMDSAIKNNNRLGRNKHRC